MNLIKSIAIMAALFGGSSFANDAEACSKAEAMELIRINQANWNPYLPELTITDDITGLVNYLRFTPMNGISTREHGDCRITSDGRRHGKIFYD